MPPVIRPKERTAIIASLLAGLVPRVGLQHLQVGRKLEIEAVLRDLTQIEQDGAAVRFIVGRYGAGKSFFLNMVRAAALEKRFVVLQADLTIDRRLRGSGGQARSLYAELLKNLAIKAKPDGGALANVVERWISEVDYEVKSAGGAESDVSADIHKRLKPLQDLVSGYDFATVLSKYLEGFLQHKDEQMAAAVRWLRAEYATKTEAHKELGVRSIIEDDEVYDFLKLLARFVQLAGYAGLLVTFDEMGVLSHRLNHAGARDANYEVILTIVNDCLTGSASRIGFYFAGVEEFLQDTRRGLYSHQALRRRLEDSQVLDLKVVDFSGPVIRLPSLTREELFVLLGKIRDIFAGGDPSKRLVTDDAIQLYMDHCRKSLGAEYYQTPSDVVRPFARFLSILERNPGIDWRGRLSSIRVERFRDGNEGQSSDKIVEDHGGPVQDASHSHLDDGLETYGT